jgi:hypothetical protein
LGAYSIYQPDVFSFTSNQASLAQMKNAAAGVFSESKYLLKELSLYQLAVAVPTHSGNFGLQAGYYGSGDYNETQVGLAYGRKLGEKVDIGAQFNYNGILINGYGSSSALTFEIGTVFHLTEKVHAGLHLYNPVGGKFGKDQQEKLPSIYTAGLGYDASEKFLISAEIEKEENQPVNILAGIQYRFIPQVLVRGGVETNTASIYFGAGLFFKTFRLDVTAGIHPELGITPGLLLVYNFSSAGKMNE